MSPEDDLPGEFEVHSPEGIRRLLAQGASPVAPIDGKLPIDCLIEMYMRSPRFAECLRVMLDAGATIADPLLEAILLDEPEELSAPAIERRLTLVCAFTSLRDVSPLHVCAEFNSVRCARALLEMGAGVDAPAGIDADGVGGHTPIFHAVNSIFNHCRPVMELLVEAGANLDLRVNALLWGGTMNWETVVYDVTPLSYAQCGLYRQFHRPEKDVYSNIDYLYQHRFGTGAPSRNVPNKYLVVGH
jgi:hypothetical protein